MSTVTNCSFSNDELKSFISNFVVSTDQFAPFAYHDKHLDCIRVQIQDCSITEERLNRIFTLYRANHSELSAPVVGFSIKGVAHLFRELGIEVSGVITIAVLLDRIVKQFPEKTVTYAKELLAAPFGSLQVEFDQAA